MSERLEIAELLLIAEAVLGTTAERLARSALLSGAESALAAPFASFDGNDFFDDPVERAAICCSRIIRNHPFPDGNKRVGYECMREMLERGGFPWPRPSEDAEEIAHTVEGLAARTVSEREFVEWVRSRVELGRRLGAGLPDRARA
jgi:death-on-curing protein